MNLAASFRGNFVQCTSCFTIKFQPSTFRSINFRPKDNIISSKQFVRRNVEVITRASESDTEPEANNDEKQEAHEDVNGQSSSGTVIDNQDEGQSEVETGVLQSESNVTESVAEKAEVDNDVQVASGSPLPGVKPRQLDESVRIPKETIDILRDQVFGFDTFFVTSQEPYEGGVLFKGNLRGQASKSYEKITKRMQDRLGDMYRFFLLVNPEDDKPVAVVVPTKTLQPDTTAVPEWFAAGAFGLVTIFTLFLRNVPALQENLLYVVHYDFMLAYIIQYYSFIDANI
ncbi:hypothetical protein Leryth_023681 [Lithospermum erythrorhizon]|nr:hypothetical protein Leryth_023681 [Lithospermum erythrorhizon]